jgi:hypothetical protein
MLIWNALKVMPLPTPVPSLLPFTDKKEKNMDSRIIYTNSNGGVSVLIPTDECGLTIEEIQEKDVPQGVQSFIVDKSDIPSDKTWRDAWVIQDGAIVVDEAKKRAIIMARFNPGMVIATVNAQITIQQRNRLIPYMAGLQAYMEYKFEDGTRNFRDAKLSLDDLNSDQRLTDAELALIKAAISAQGINLDDF